MKIYIAHSRQFDFIGELYQPIKGCEELWQRHEFIFPHDQNSDGVYSKHIVQTSDVMIAEVSYPSTGMGIEIGWAHEKNIPIFCFCKSNCTPSASLGFISKNIVMYQTKQDLIRELSSIAIK